MLYWFCKPHCLSQKPKQNKNTNLCKRCVFSCFFSKNSAKSRALWNRTLKQHYDFNRILMCFSHKIVKVNRQNWLKTSSTFNISIVKGRSRSCFNVILRHHLIYHIVVCHLICLYIHFCCDVLRTKQYMIVNSRRQHICLFQIHLKKFYLI